MTKNEKDELIINLFSNIHQAIYTISRAIEQTSEGEKGKYLKRLNVKDGPLTNINALIDILKKQK